MKKYLFIGLVVILLLFFVIAEDVPNPNLKECEGDNSYSKEGFDFAEGDLNELASEDSKTFTHTRAGKKIELENIVDSKFVFDGDCLMKSANFTVDPKAEGVHKYILGEYEYEVPKGSKVIYKKGEGEDGKDSVEIIQPAGTELKDPTLVKGSENPDAEIKISTEGDGALITEQGRLQSLAFVEEGSAKAVPTSVYYEHRDGKLLRYSKDKYFTMLSEDGQGEFLVANPVPGENIYLSFDAADLDSIRDLPSVVITKDRLLSVNFKGIAPAISISTSNRYGLGLNAEGGNDLVVGENSVALQGLNGYAGIQRGVDTNPQLALSGDSIYGPDGESFFLRDGEVIYKDVPIIKGVAHAEGTVYLTTRLVDTETGNDLKDFSIYANNDKEYILVKNGILKGPRDYFAKEGVVVSNSVKINQGSTQFRNNLASLSPEESVEFSSISAEFSPAELEVAVKEIHDRIDGSERGVDNIVNGYRASAGLASLKLNPHVSRRAKEYSKYMVDHGYVHSKGWLGGTGYGENIHKISYNNPQSDEEIYGRLSREWYASPGHKSNILGNYRESGIGVYHHYDGTFHHYYGTQMFIP